jgi:pimeloyl-ACP methyl ester carboxylesterase
MSVIRTPEINIHLQRLHPVPPPTDGKPPIVVFLHGLLYDSLASYYFTLGPAFANAGMDVVMYDLRGHGRSTKFETGYRLEHFLGDLDALLDALEITEPVHLVGNSFGGTMAYGYAATRPERVASITAIESSPPTPTWMKHLGSGLAEAKDKLARDESIDWISQQHGAHTARLTKGAGKLLHSTTMAEDLPLSLTIAEDLSEVRCPVFALFGDESGLDIQVDSLRDGLVDCHVVVLPQQGHSVLVERTGETSGLILDWIGRHSRAALVEVD